MAAVWILSISDEVVRNEKPLEPVLRSYTYIINMATQQPADLHKLLVVDQQLQTDRKYLNFSLYST
jgi:hypothetical protein